MGIFKNHDLDEEARLELEHEKRGVFAYIDIVFRKFVPLMNVNFLFLAFSVPYILFLFLAKLSFVEIK